MFVFSATDPWSSESSEGYVTLQLSPGESSLAWGDLGDMDPDSGAFLRPPATPSPSPSTTTQEELSPSTPADRKVGQFYNIRLLQVLNHQVLWHIGTFWALVLFTVQYIHCIGCMVASV